LSLFRERQAVIAEDRPVKGFWSGSQRISLTSRAL
jgi:hypothetical protein